MTSNCHCSVPHHLRRVVLTGGPGAGKTAVLEMLSHEVCPHVQVTHEAAGILFGGGFPRAGDAPHQRAAQRAIFHVQLEIETLAGASEGCLVLFDRGLPDGAAYWPGPEDFWKAVGMSRHDALRRYDTVVHLRTPDAPNGYGHQNPLRTETAAQANAIDQRILQAWDGHPRRFVVDAAASFQEKAARAIAIIQAEIPVCCGGGFGARG